MKRISIGTLIISLLIPLLVGALSAAISMKAMAAYGTMEKPPLSPPAWVFSVAWTILYLIMGLASYFVFISETDSRDKTLVLTLYAIQLAMNFMWSIIFFNFGLYLLAFGWLIIMWALVIFCACKFFQMDKIAGLLMVPYILWLTFAAYLNMGTYVLQVQKK